MIEQTQKPVQEILEYLQGRVKIIIIGCGGCATVFHTESEPEVKETAKRLTYEKKKIPSAVAPPFGEFACYAPWSKNRLKQFKKEIENCDAILMLCVDGLQGVRELILEEELQIVKPIYPATNPVGHMGEGLVLYREKCQQCGKSEPGKFAGICPLTHCASGLLQGPAEAVVTANAKLNRNEIVPGLKFTNA